MVQPIRTRRIHKRRDRVVMTDDLVMGAIYQRNVCAAVVEALNAGVDLLLVAFDGAQFSQQDFSVVAFAAALGSPSAIWLKPRATYGSACPWISPTAVVKSSIATALRSPICIGRRGSVSCTCVSSTRSGTPSPRCGRSGSSIATNGRPIAMKLTKSTSAPQ